MKMVIKNEMQGTFYRRVEKILDEMADYTKEYLKENIEISWRIEGRVVHMDLKFKGDNKVQYTYSSSIMSNFPGTYFALELVGVIEELLTQHDAETIENIWNNIISGKCKQEMYDYGFEPPDRYACEYQINWDPYE